MLPKLIRGACAHCGHRRRDHRAVDRTGRLWCDVMVLNGFEQSDMGTSCRCPGYAHAKKTLTPGARAE